MRFYSKFKASLIAVIGVGCLIYPSKISEDPNITKVDHQQKEEIIEEKKTFPVQIDEDQLSEALKRDFLSSNQYNRKIQKEVNNFLPVIDWRIVKAQFYQESKLDPEAESPVGAKGLAQFMGPTWEEVLGEMNQEGSRTDPHLSIQMGVYYNSKLWSFWSSPRPHYHRVAYMLGSYNAGAGSLLEAQKACKEHTEDVNCNLYPPTKSHLHLITGKHHKETETYVKNIFNYYVLEKLW